VIFLPVTLTYRNFGQKPARKIEKITKKPEKPRKKAHSGHEPQPKPKAEMSTNYADDTERIYPRQNARHKKTPPEGRRFFARTEPGG
jgi:hypothetical protein